jgi:hypothetical protein
MYKNQCMYIQTYILRLRKAVNLSVALCIYKMLSLNLRGRHRLQVFGNKKREKYLDVRKTK